jgi:cysteine desulfurase
MENEARVRAAAHDDVYLDHNATTPVLPEVLEAMLPYLTDQFGNPSSEHGVGRRSRDAVDRAREQVAATLSCLPDEILFTSGGTESNNLAILGSAATAAADRRRLMTSCVEHPATLRPCEHLEKSGWAVNLLPVTASGHVDPDEVRRAMGPDVALLSLMLAQNETGALMPVAEAADAAHAVGALVHTDAAQAVGKIALDVDVLGVDLLTVAGHKCYAPKGVGALYVRRGTALAPVLLGGGQERGMRPGTENVAGIVALGAACELATARLPEESERIARQRDSLWETLATAIPALTRHTAGIALPNTLNVSFPEVSGRDLLALADGVAASTGSACHAGEEQPSVVLLAMGVAPDAARGAVRLSLGHGTTDAHIKSASTVLCSAYQQLIGA